VEEEVPQQPVETAEKAEPTVGDEVKTEATESAVPEQEAGETEEGDSSSEEASKKTESP
jgi:hypothetical protein